LNCSGRMRIKDAFFGAMRGVSQKLGDYPPLFEGSGNDVQVFRLQQLAIGELVAVRKERKRSCMGYGTFVTKLAETRYQTTLMPLQRLIDAIKPGERRWHRLEAVRSASLELETRCESLLNVPKRN
jgi:hypothetical protein